VVVVPTCVLAGHAFAANCACVHSGVAVTAPTSPGGRWTTKPSEVPRGLLDIEVQREVRVGAGLRVGGRRGDASGLEGLRARRHEKDHGADDRRAEGQSAEHAREGFRWGSGVRRITQN
jgi:hypothetical protein